MEQLDLLNVNDLYSSQEKLSNDLQNLNNLLNFFDKTDKKDNESVKNISTVLSPAEESYLENIIDNKVDAIIHSAKYNIKLKNSLHKLVDAFRIFDTSIRNRNMNYNIQTQTPPRSPLLTDEEIQTDLDDNEVIVLETINNNKNDSLIIIDNNTNNSINNNNKYKNSNEGENDIDKIKMKSDESISNLKEIKRIRQKFIKLVKEQQRREKEKLLNNEIKNDKDKENDDNDKNENKNENEEVKQVPVSNLTEAIKSNYKNDIDENGKDSFNIKENNSIFVNEKVINNTNNEIDNSQDNFKISKPINIKNRKNYKRRNKNNNTGESDLSNKKLKDTFTNPMLLSPAVSSFSPSPSPSQGIYLGKSNTQQTVLSTKIQSIFSKQNTSTKDAECQTDSYKVVIRGEDYFIPPGYFGHYAVVPLWTIWVIGYYYKKKTKPKSMWRFLALKTPSLLAKSRAQNGMKAISKVEQIN